MRGSGLLILLLAVFFGGSSAAICEFAAGNFRVQYGLMGQNIYFQLVLAGVPNTNGWTAIGFGNSMFSGLDVIVIRLLNGRVHVTDEYVRGHTHPFPDTNSVSVTAASYQNGMIMARFSRPVQTGDPYDHPLGGCSTWQFATILNRMGPDGSLYHHSMRPVPHVVCLEQCRI
ncbi:unnamed protein product, partial [Mesorhabditis spiculigera]